MDGSEPSVRKLPIESAAIEQFIADENHRKSQRERKKTVLQKDRINFLQRLIDLLRYLDPQLRDTHPMDIARFAAQLANFPKANTEENYLTEKELSREIQKVLREMQEES